MNFDQFPKGVNSYLVLKNTGHPVAQVIVSCLDRAMDDTGVKPEKTARETVGDVVYRLMVASIRGGKLKVNTEDMPGMNAVCNTYDAFRAMLDAVKWGEVGE